MKKRNVLLIAMILGILLSGCRRCDDYEYLAFDPSTGAVPMQIGMLELDGLNQTEPYPLAYLLRRQGYTLKIEANPTSFLASVIVSIESSDGVTLHVPPIEAASRSCLSYADTPLGKIQFTWWGVGGCDEYRYISIDVVSSTGQPIANERLPFGLEKAGTYCVMEGT